jgi:hypothetical protein
MKFSRVHGRGLGICWSYERGWFTVGRKWGWQYPRGLMGKK